MICMFGWTAVCPPGLKTVICAAGFGNNRLGMVFSAGEI